MFIGLLGSRHQQVIGIRNLMKFLYVESQRPTRDECSWVICMAETGFNINYVAFHFDIHKTIANRIIKQSWLEIARDRAYRRKPTPLEERYIQIASRRMTFLTANTLCIYITSRDCLLYVIVHQNCTEPSPMHVENVQNIGILSFWKTFYDRYCAPYKWNYVVVVIR